MSKPKPQSILQFYRSLVEVSMIPVCIQCNQERIEKQGSEKCVYVCFCVCLWGQDGLNRDCCFNSDFMCGFVWTPEVWFPLDSVQRLQGLLLLSFLVRPT